MSQKIFNIKEMQKGITLSGFSNVSITESERDLLIPAFQRVICEILQKNASKAKYLTDLLIDLVNRECFAVANIKYALLTYGDLISKKTFTEMFELLMHF